MFMNLDTLPADQAMYTLAVTDAPAGHTDEMWYDEVDVVASRLATVGAVIQAARDAGSLEGYKGCRVVGLVNQSKGVVMFEDASSQRVI